MSYPFPLRARKIMIGFVVRRCAVDLGHPPDAAEFASWANGTDGQGMCLFGRPISESEAHVILQHQSRLVSARSATADEQYIDADAFALPTNGNVVNLAEMRARASNGTSRHRRG